MLAAIVAFIFLFPLKGLIFSRQRGAGHKKQMHFLAGASACPSAPSRAPSVAFTGANGSNDMIIYTVNSYILQQILPSAQLILYPDGNHGAQYQYPELFVDHVSLFLRD